MRRVGRLLLAVSLGACNFTARAQPDAAPDVGTPIDAAIDAPDASTLPFWTSVIGANANGNNLTSTAAAPGWDTAGAVSRAVIASGDGYLQFTTMETNRGKAIGLSNGDTNQDITDIDFAFLAAANGSLYVFEGGTERTMVGSYTSSDVLKIEVAGNLVLYRKNAALVYTSFNPPTYPLLVDSALYHTGATLMNVSIVSSP